MPLAPVDARRLRAVAERAGRLVAERDRLIRSAVRSGASLREVARLVGMSHSGVKRVIDRGDDQ